MPQKSARISAQASCQPLDCAALLTFPTTPKRAIIPILMEARASRSARLLMLCIVVCAFAKAVGGTKTAFHFPSTSSSTADVMLNKELKSAVQDGNRNRINQVLAAGAHLEPQDEKEILRDIEDYARRADRQMDAGDVNWAWNNKGKADALRDALEYYDTARSDYVKSKAQQQEAPSEAAQA